MTTPSKGLLLASKSGDITATKLIRETDCAWHLQIEGRDVRVSKTDPRRRTFENMKDALEWAGAEPELIAEFSEPASGSVGDKHV